MTILHDYINPEHFVDYHKLHSIFYYFIGIQVFETNLNLVDSFSRLRIAVNFVPVQEECILTHILYPFAHQMHG